MANKEIIFITNDNIEEVSWIFVTHGYSGSAQEIVDYSGMNDLLSQHGFSVCYPEAHQIIGV